MRRNIALQYDDKKKTKIYLYTHWGADGLEKVLAEALEFGKGRWDDHSYLARIIFSRMIQDQVLEETGYGIAPFPIDEEFPTIKVNLADRTVNNVAYVNFIKEPEMFKI